MENPVKRAESILGWMEPDELAWLYETAQSMDSIVELGCFRGRSTYVLCAGCRGKVYAVDCHYCGTMWPFGNEKQHTYEEFMANCGHYENMVPYCGHFCEAAVSDIIPPEFDMVFIDGAHEYPAVLADLQTWATRARKMVCGHDLDPTTPGVEQALAEFCGMDRVVKCPGRLWYIKKE